MFEDMFPYNRTIRQVKKFIICIYTSTPPNQPPPPKKNHTQTQTEKRITLSESANAMGD